MEGVFIKQSRAGGEKADVIYDDNYGSFMMVLLRFAVLLVRYTEVIGSTPSMRFKQLFWKLN